MEWIIGICMKLDVLGKDYYPYLTVEQSRKVNHWKTFYAKATIGWLVWICFPLTSPLKLIIKQNAISKLYVTCTSKTVRTWKTCFSNEYCFAETYLFFHHATQAYFFHYLFIRGKNINVMTNFENSILGCCIIDSQGRDWTSCISSFSVLFGCYQCIYKLLMFASE